MNIDRVKAIYAEIEKYEVQLAPDPRSLGPLYLQNTIAECRNYLNAVSRIQLEVHREKQAVSRSLRAAEAAHEVSFTEVLANDERVRRLPSIEDRKATANVILREELNAITALKAELQDLEYVEKAVRYRHKELTSSMSEVKLQRSLIRDEIDSGAMYGDERQFDHERKPSHGPLGDDVDEAELAALLEGAQEEAAGASEGTPEVAGDAPESAPEVVTDPISDVVAEEVASPASESESEGEPETAESPTEIPMEDFDDVFAKL